MAENESTGKNAADSAQEKMQLDATFADIKKVCKKERLTALEESDGGHTTLNIWFERAPDAQTIRVFRLDQAKNLLASHFERYRPLSNYQAILSLENGDLEAAVGTIGFGPWGGSGRAVLSRLKKALGKENLKSSEPVIQSTSPDTKVRVTIGQMSKTLHGFFPRKDPDVDRPSLVLCGLDTNNCNPVYMLERIADSLFFELDRALGITLGLRRAWPNAQPRRQPLASISDLKRLPYEFKKEAMDYYWYAKSAFNMPDLQFLLYYEAIECYFSGERGIEPLKRTLECLDPNALREFLASDEEMSQFFAAENRPYSIDMNSESAKLIRQVAVRIYGIRNNTAHSDNRWGDGYTNVFARCRYEHRLDFDVDLIQYVAQQVIFEKRRDLRSVSTR